MYEIGTLTEWLQQISGHLMYLIIGLLLLAAFIKTYTKWTPYHELTLIRSGNVAATLSLSGAALGFTINIIFAMFYAYSPLQFFLYGLFSLVLQMAIYSLIQKVSPETPKEIEANNIAVGGWVGLIALCVGILNGASAS